MKALMRFVRRVLLCALALSALWLAGFTWFAQAVARPGADVPQTDAIVVLTGGAGRIDQGLKLLEEGRAPRLFISGVEGEEALSRLAARGGGKVALGREARNTIGNAVETAAWARAEGMRSLLLVTADYHMPRARCEFRYAMPEAEIFAAPVHTQGAGRSRLIISEYHKWIAARLRHELIDLSNALRERETS